MGPVASSMGPVASEMKRVGNVIETREPKTYQKPAPHRSVCRCQYDKPHQ